MANELSFINPNVQFSKNGLALNWAPGTKQVSVSGDQIAHTVQGVGTSAEAIVFGDIPGASYGYAIFRNLDSSNFVVLSLESDGSSPFAKLKPGEIAILRLTQSDVYYAKADTAACNLEIIAIED